MLLRQQASGVRYILGNEQHTRTICIIKTYGMNGLLEIASHRLELFESYDCVLDDSESVSKLDEEMKTNSRDSR